MQLNYSLSSIMSSTCFQGQTAVASRLTGTFNYSADHNVEALTLLVDFDDYRTYVTLTSLGASTRCQQFIS